ncbi:inorganic phosphate transporter [soil metagenome]
MDSALIILVFLIGVALLFDMLNGLHDAANSIAAIVSTRVLSPKMAVLLAGFFNFIAFTVFPLNVAHTIGKGIISPDLVTDQVIFGALMGAIVWNLLTWWRGIPSSSSHALVGGLVGAGVAHAGVHAIVWNGLSKTALAIVLSPTMAFSMSLLLILLVSWALVKATPSLSDRMFRVLQFVSASWLSLSHGGNDAQKTMGIITVLLYSHGALKGEFTPPFWVILSCQAAMGIGTMFGGWKIVRTMGSKITRLTPMYGFCAEAAAATTLTVATQFGIPVSTTQTISGAIVGVGASRRLSAVRWIVAKDIVLAWFITLPCAALMAAGFYWLGGFIL